MSTYVLNPVPYCAEINSKAPNTAYGGSTTLSVADVVTAKSLLWRSFIVADLSSLAGATVDASSTLVLIVATWINLGGEAAKIYRVIRNIDAYEANITWNKYDGTNAWATAGCGGAGTDYDNTLYVDVTIPAVGGDGILTVTGAGFAAMIQDAIDNRAGMLRLFIRLATESADTGVVFNSETGWPPVLTVVYTGLAVAKPFSFATMI